jgi:predicted MFS family arabinose efflux permease
MTPGKSIVVAALGTTQTLAWASSYYLPAILGAPIAAALGLSTNTFFAVFSASLLLGATLSPWVGSAIDHYGGRPVLTLSSTIIAAGLAVLGAAQGLASLVAAWLLLGVGMALGLYDPAFAALTRLYGRAARAPITGITLIAGFASTIGWPASTWFEHTFGWRDTCLIWAALNLLIALPLNWLLIPPAPSVARQRSEAVGTAEAPPPRGAMPLLASYFCATAFVTGAMAAHLPRLLESTGASETAAIAAGALVGPAQVAARLVEFGLLRTIHPVWSGRIAAAMHPLGAGLLAVAGPAAAPLFALLHGAGNGMITIARGTLPLAVFGPRDYGLRTGILAAPSRVTLSAAPFLFGLLLDRVGTEALVLSAGLSLVALAALLLLQPSPEPHPASAADD